MLRIFPAAICALAVLSAMPASAQTPVRAPLPPADARWRTDGVPVSGDSAWTRAASAACWWSVETAGGRLALRSQGAPGVRRAGLPGGIVEAGPNGLAWISGGASSTVVAGEPFTALMAQRSRIFALSGRPAGSDGRGSGRLWLVESRPGTEPPIAAVWLVDLQEPGWALCEAGSSDRLWVVSETRLYQVDITRKTVATVIDRAFWSGLRPVSAVEIDGVVHIGMRGGVASAAWGSRTLAWTERLDP